MHSTINCEHVFDVLTRGPVSLNEEPEVREHLCHCSDCRRLAEAFRPAVGLIHEALDDQGLPSVEGLPHVDELLFDVHQLNGEATVTRADRESELDARPQPLLPPILQQPRTPSWLSLLVAVLAGVALFAWASANGRDGASTVPPNASEQVRLPKSHPPLISSEGGTTLCCVECQRPGSEKGQPPVVMLAQSCMTCHVQGEL